MTQVESVSMQSRSDYPSPSAKRGLDFISADIDKPNADALPTGDDTDQTVGENDSALLADSPVKNSEGKLKLS